MVHWCMPVNLFPCILQMEGFVNYDVWHWIVGYLVDDLRINRDFPLYPNVSCVAIPNYRHFDF